MSKTKNNNKTNHTNIDEQKYRAVAAAIAVVLQQEKESQEREIAKGKVKRVLGIFTMIGAIILIALSCISNYDYDFSWMSNLKKWYSDIYVSFLVYIMITDIVLVLEHKFNFDKKPLFGYMWPFIGFFISLLLTNSMNVSLVPYKSRTLITVFLLSLIPATVLMKLSFDIGKDKAKRKNDIIKKASNIIESNPEMVEKVWSDFENDCKKKNGDS